MIRRMPRIPGYLIVLALLLAATSATAIDVTLAPEVPVSPPVVTAAPFEQRLAGLTNDGADFLAIWFDRRGSIPSVPNASTAAPLYVTKLDTSGKPAKPFGVKLVDAAVTAALVKTNAGFVVLWSNSDQVNWMVINNDGVPLTQPARLTDGYLTAATSNGSTLFVIHGPFGGEDPLASIFTLDGREVLRVHVTSPDTIQTIHPIVLSDNDYGIVADGLTCLGGSPCFNDESLTIINNASTVRSTRLRTLGGYTQSAVAVAGDRLLIAYMTDSTSGPTRTSSFQLFNLSGDALRPESIIDSTNAVGTLNAGFAPSVGWDGHQFIIAYQWPSPDQQSGEIRTVRVDTNGNIVDPQPVTLTPVLGRPPFFSLGTNGVLVAWDTPLNTSSDIAVRAGSSFSELATGFTRFIPQSAALQTQVQVATIGSNSLAVWREGDATGSIVAATPTKTPIVISPSFALDQERPEVAANSNSYLVAWREQPSVTSSQSALYIVAKRVSLDGTVLDRDPIVIATDTVPVFSGIDPIAVASDGTDFFVVWTSSNDRIHGARVRANGTVVDTTPIDLSVPGTPISPRIVYVPGAYLVVWSSDPSCKLCGAPPGPPISQIYAARVSTTGQVINSPRIIWTGGAVPRLGLGRGAGGTMLAWAVAQDVNAANVCVYTMPLTNDGSPDGSPHAIRCGATSGDVDVAWDGGTFVVAWTEFSAFDAVAKAIRVTSQGSAWDRDPFSIAATTPSFEPSLAPLPDGVLIGYERVANEEIYGGVARAFTRKLLKADLPPRRRAVR